KEKDRFKSLMSTLDHIANATLDAPPPFDANVLYDQFLHFVRVSLLTHATFVEKVTKGKKDTSDLGLQKAQLDAGFTKVEIAPFTLDSDVEYPKTRGVVVGGIPYVLEDYGDT